MQGVELEKRVEVHELDARKVIYVLLGHLFEVLFHHPHRMGVAVAVGVAQQTAVLANEGEVDAPGIDTYRSDFNTFAGHYFKTADDFVV